MLLQELVAHRADGLRVGGDGIQIQQRDSELIGSGDGNIACGRQVRRNQMGHQIGALFLCLDDSVLHGVSSRRPSCTSRWARPPSA